MAGRDITEGRSTRAVAVDIGVVSSTAIWQNTDMSYDVAVGGLPFFYAINDTRPYTRQTAPFKKDQFDSSTEPGEQSLAGWWLRSQASFHSGSGIKFYDPATTDENGHYRFADSKGLNIWTKGQVTLLRSCNTTHYTTGTIASNGRPKQYIRSIQWSGTQGNLLVDDYDVDKIASDGTLTHFIDYTAGAGVYPVYAICDDGTYAYWVTNKTSGATTKLTMFKKPLTGSASDTSDEVQMWQDTAIISNATMEYVKERIILCADNKIYEIPTSATALPSPLCPAQVSGYVYTSVAASGPAIYVSGYNGIKSSIYKFTLGSNATLPTLTAAGVCAELPEGEIVHKIFYYLGYMMIGTNLGVRAANISEVDGSLSYGPLIVQTSQPCYDFAARDHYVWCATSVNGEPGTTRIDLSNEIEQLRFAYANDIYYDGVTGHVTTGCAFSGNTDRLTFVTAYASSENGGIYIESSATLRTSGYLTTGNIRFGTLEPKNFKRLVGRGNFSYGSMTLETVDKNGVEYDHISYDASVSPVEVTTSSPATAQEYVAYKFILYRDGTDTTQGPIFKGYQAKATIAVPRQRIIQFPVYNYDVETDRYNASIGYQGRASTRLAQLESIEELGDIVTWQDLTTGESRQAIIEQVSFTRMTPPDKRFDGFGGIILITIMTV